MSRHPDSGGVGVNYRPGIPRYLQIADAIRQDLRGEGERIPSEHALCKRFKVSRPTIRQALDVLVDAALAPRQIAELLQVRSRSPLLLFERTYFAASGEPVEYAITYQTPRRYPYRLVLSRAERRS